MSEVGRRKPVNMKKGEFLIINNNNTRTKFALASADAVLDHRAVKTSDLSLAAVAEMVAGWDFPRALIASVVPRDVPLLLESQAGKQTLILDHQLRLGVEIDFPRPQSVGADRLANAAAVADRVGNQPVVVVDFGTAVTFDIVDTRPAYIGGVIAPGLEAMTHYLHHRTALLPRIEIREPASAIGRSTEEAMLSGAFHGYRGLVKEIIAQLNRELGIPARVIATGGYAELISRHLPVIESVEPLLTMEGLRKIAKLNF